MRQKGRCVQVGSQHNRRVCRGWCPLGFPTHQDRKKHQTGSPLFVPSELLDNGSCTPVMQRTSAHCTSRPRQLPLLLQPMQLLKQLSAEVVAVISPSGHIAVAAAAWHQPPPRPFKATTPVSLSLNIPVIVFSRACKLTDCRKESTRGVLHVCSEWAPS